MRWGAHASCVLAKASGVRELFLELRDFRKTMKVLEKVRFGKMPKPAGWKRALPRGVFLGSWF
jgi:hypothetical protein